MSYLATGHMPMPVTPDSATWDTIPPFYSPFVREVPEVSNFGSGLADVAMSDEVRSSLVPAFLALTPFGQSNSNTQFAFAFHSTMAFSDSDSSVGDASNTSMEY